MTKEEQARLAKLEADVAAIKAALKIEEPEDRLAEGFLRFRANARKRAEA